MSQIDSIPVEHYTDQENFILRPFQAYRKQGGLKPDGALWTSPVGSEFSWTHWCENENFERKSYRVELLISTENMITIDSQIDQEKLPWLPVHPKINSMVNLDIGRLIRKGIYAIWLTVQGEASTRYTYPMTFYGWDCETICLLTHKPILLVNGKEPVYDLDVEPWLVRQELMETQDG